MNPQTKLALLATGLITLSVAALSAWPVFSQSTNSPAPTNLPAKERMHRLDFLNLTEEQQATLDQIRQNERSQIDAVLTDEQKAQLQSARENRRPPSPLDSLNLTTEQRSQVEAVRNSFKEQMDAVLTLEQRQQLQQSQAEGNPRHRFDSLNLTEEQQTALDQLRQNQRSQIDAILTDEQKAQIQSARENRGPRGGEDRRMRPSPFDSLNLTAEQRTQIEAIRSAAKEQMDAVLTPEQRQQLELHRQQHQQQRQQREQDNSQPPEAQ